MSPGRLHVATNLKFPGQAAQDEEVVSQRVETHFARQLNKLDTTTALALKLLQKNDSMTVPRALGKAPILVIQLFAKLLKTVRAIRVVASLSLVEDGQVLCRTLAETAVAIRYLLQKKSSHRAEEYLAHTLMRTKDVAEKWQKTRGLKRRAQQIVNLVDQELPPFAHLGAPRLKELRKWYYGNKPMRDMFKEVGLEKLYPIAYLQFTGVQHVSDALQHAEIGEAGGVAILLGSSNEEQMNTLLLTTTVLLWLTIARLSRKLNLGYQAEIESLKPEHKVHDSLRAWSRRKRARSATSTSKSGP
jgi:hypothetical protein